MSANVQTLAFVNTEKYPPDFHAATRDRIKRFDCQDSDFVYDVSRDRYPVRALGYCPLQDLWFSVFQGTISILSLIEGISSTSALGRQYLISSVSANPAVFPSFRAYPAFLFFPACHWS